MAEPGWEGIAASLGRLGEAVRDRVLAGRGADADPAGVDRVAASDTIYRIDRFGEEALRAWFAESWPPEVPVEVIAEGLGDETGERFPEAASGPRMTVLVDPIDGTRGLMYDKRPAWVLAGAAAGVGGTLADLRAGAMVEIPPTKQTVSDVLLAWADGSGGFRRRCRRFDSASGASVPLSPAPSGAADLRHGFASFASFFPEGRAEIEAIENAFLRRHLPEYPAASPLVFADQYISTGGQLYELLAGRDRMVADLRPLVFRRLGWDGCLSCHPYDLAGLPVALASGVVVENPWGGPVAAPLDTTTPVAWVAYANRSLADTLRPLLREALWERGYPEQP